MKTGLKGSFGESIAKNYLINKGYLIIEQNFKTKFGEIDIIAKCEDYIVFVEVKTRKNANYGYPCEFVDRRKQRRIIKTYEIYMVSHKLNLQCRYDVIEIYLDKRRINHLINAF